MDQKILFEINKFKALPTFFTDRKKVFDFNKVIKNLPKNSQIIIREYDLNKKDREDFAKRISLLAKDRSLKILVGKDIDLAKKIKADGVHFSDFDQIPLKFLQKKSFPKNFIFSFSCHSYKSFLKAKKLNCDQVFIAPIFTTTSHNNAKKFGLNNLAKISLQKENLNYAKPLICALGGINLQNLKSLRKIKTSSFGAIDLFLQND